MSDEPTNIIDIRPLLLNAHEKRVHEFYAQIAAAVAEKIPQPEANENPIP